MKITVLGSASGMPVPHRHPSAYLVEEKSKLYLIDAGDGAAQQLVRYGIDFNEIRCVFISHTHPDHVGGLFMLLQSMHLIERKNPLRIFLPQGVLPDFESIFPLFQIFREKWPFHFELVPISNKIILKEELQVQAIPNNHLLGNKQLAEKSGVGHDSYSFRISGSERKTVVYTSDVDALDHLNGNLSGVNVLIAECTHINVETILDLARSTGIPRVVLTHIPPELEETSIDIEKLGESITVQFANDGNVIEV